MLQISAELLAISSDAAVLAKNGKIVFSNASAMELLGRDCIGRTVRELLGDEVAAVQASSYIGEFPVNGERYIIRERFSEGISAIFLAKSNDREALINDAYIYSLRNCLMNIGVALNLLRNSSEEHPELRDSIALISHDSYKINRILSNVGILLSVQQKQFELNVEKFELRDFLKNIVDSTRILVDGPKIGFTAPEPIIIHADKGMLEVLMLNLISNCLVHAPDCKNISISVTKNKNSCMLAIDDDGCGIAPEMIHQVFERYKYGFEINDVNKGPGLGLSVARAIANLHGGTILLESRPGIGTAVRVSLSTLPNPNIAKQPLTPYVQSMENLLTGLAPCLPAEFYTEKYLD